MSDVVTTNSVIKILFVFIQNHYKYQALWANIWQEYVEVSGKHLKFLFLWTTSLPCKLY